MLSKTSLGMIAAAFSGLAMFASPALAADAGHEAAATVHEHPTPTRQDWSFAGFFGKYDRAQLQRGFQVYREVCAACHSANELAFRNLSEPGGPEFSEAQVKALAELFKIKDGFDESGSKPLIRSARPSDKWPWNFQNVNEARTANGGALPPDMSVLAKARAYHRPFPLFLIDALPGFAYQEHGVDYIVALMNGYEDNAPKGQTLDAGQNWNNYFPGNKIMMPKPLAGDGQVTYTDGTPSTVDNYAKDVAAFMMWVAEPKLEKRKRTGFEALVFLAILTGLLYASKKRVWANVEH